jgi:multidrug efflux pump subunit AcrA (membrane-fusion protein)
MDLKIEGIQLRITHSEQAAEKLRGQLEDVVMLAPTGGLLRLTHKYVWSSRNWMPITVGQDVRALDIAGTVVDPDKLFLRVQLHESDYPLIRPGQPVTAFLTAFPEQELRGTVRAVTGLGQDRDDLSPIYRQSAPISQALFLATIDLDSLNAAAMPGMTADVYIEVEPAAERLHIPGEALSTSSPPHRVWRRNQDGQPEEILIEGAFTDEGDFSVTRGLRPDDSVRVPNGRSRR